MGITGKSVDDEGKLHENSVNRVSNFRRILPQVHTVDVRKYYI